ncbi:MAG: DNA internalization-related competence protein ComEC/Rec2 [Casimicrobiaceae bacterium]|nr:DNA internalization-related competence protein ComEC/Rec2 [Casimicrobiaceae bacterium]
MIIEALAAFAVGVALAQRVPELPPLAVTLVVASACTALAAWRLVRGKPGRLLLIVCALGFGASYAWLRAEWRLAEALDAAWEGRPVELVGVVDELPARYGDVIRFAFRVEGVLTPGARVPKRLALSWFRPRSGEIAGEALPALRAGERWQWFVRLSRPHGYANGHGFDLEAWMLEHGLRASGSIEVDRPMRRLATSGGALTDHVNRLREAVRERLDRALGGHPARPVLAALTIGDQRAIPAELWSLYNAAAVSHLLSVSGAHVTLFATWVAALVFFLWRRSAVLLLRLPAQKAAAAVALVIAFGYALLAGFEVPAQRTCLMLAVAALGLFTNRRLSPWLILAWALVAVLLVDPWATLSPGFWFSFLAVALLVYLHGGRFGRALPWRLLLSTQALMAVGLAPITLVLFGQVSLIGPLANAVAIPLVTLFVVPLALLWLVVPVDLILWLAAWGVNALTALCQALVALPAALWLQHTPPFWAVLLALIGTLYLFAPRGWPGRWVGALLWLPIFTVTPARPSHGEFRLTALDVGQGTAIVIETAKATLLYDAGPRWTDSFDAGNRLIVPWLHATANPRLDTLVLSHLDRDHAGGALSLLRELPVARLVANLPAGEPLAELLRAQAAARAVRVEPCVAGRAWVRDAVRFELLAPRSESVATTRANEASCVLKVTAARGLSVLLPGDAEGALEAELLALGAPALRADWLVAAHHGARGSSGKAFLDAVAPRQVIITVGHRNRYGHPHPETLARFAARGIIVHRTDRAGALTFDSSRGAWQVPRAARQAHARYWRLPEATITSPHPPAGPPVQDWQSEATALPLP